MKTCPSCARTLTKMEIVLGICKVCHSKLPAPTAEELEVEWFEGGELMLGSVEDVPEEVWSAILKILRHKLTDEQEPLLAAGALEDLLVHHGPLFIERVEREATQNPSFNHLLGGVWHSSIQDDVWKRIQKARQEVW